VPFFKGPARTEIYTAVHTRSLPDARPISRQRGDSFDEVFR
jgi:hypothetical protein